MMMLMVSSSQICRMISYSHLIFFTAIEDELFNATMEIIHRQKWIRAIEIVASTILWFNLEQTLAQILDIYPTSLHAQYHFSTDSKQTLPLDLTLPQHLNMLITLLWPLVVPWILANGCHSNQPMKAVTVHVIQQGQRPCAEWQQGLSFPCYFRHTACWLTLRVEYSCNKVEIQCSQCGKGKDRSRQISWEKEGGSGGHHTSFHMCDP